MYVCSTSHHFIRPTGHKLTQNQLQFPAQDIFFQRKERKRISLKREYIGDYIGFLDNPGLRALVDKKERVLYADDVNKYDRRYKPQKRTMLLTAKELLLIALVPFFSSFLLLSPLISPH